MQQTTSIKAAMKKLFYAITIFLLFSLNKDVYASRSLNQQSLKDASSKRIYLTGKGASDALLWDFKMSVGRNSGYWTSIMVPSNWEFQGFGYYTYWRDREDYATNPEIGNYKRTFQMPSTKKKRMRLVFQGSMTDTKVKINGKSAGETHQGGYNQFSYDITALIKSGTNLIEVEVSKPSANHGVELAERVADFWLFGGIYRPVYIDILPDSYVERAAIDAQMDGQLTANVYLREIKEGQTVWAQVYTVSGKSLGKPITLKVNAKTNKITIEGKFSNVKLWSDEFPNLYELKISLKNKKQTIHTIKEKFGFRTFEVKDHDGFYLNGKRILLKGASMHSFRPETGRALSAEDNLSDVKLMKSLNFNTVRAPCYPPDEHFLDLCDSLGLMVLNELSGWSKPLPTDIGKKLVKELIIRDVNHPSIIMWGNGNHYSHNADLEDDFLKWDIQQRRPYKNAARNEPWPGKKPGKFQLIDTRYYPTYKELMAGLASDQIVCPLETLHALFDGGGGASLDDYWQSIEKSKVGGGLIIWALYDEGVFRGDEGYRIDNQGNFAPDGLVGPHQQKEGSYNTVKKIWSPVQVNTSEISENFDGRINVNNKFNFTNLNQCLFSWKLIKFASPKSTQSGYTIADQGEMRGPDVLAGKTGILQIPVSSKFNDAEAIEITAFDPQGTELWTWELMKTPRRDFMSDFLATSIGNKVSQDSVNKWVFYSGNTTFLFDKETGMPLKIKTDSTLFPITNLIHIVAETEKGKYNVPEKKNNVLPMIKKEGDSYLISTEGQNGFDRFNWRIMPGGVLKANYTYTLPADKYYYAGVGLNIASDNVTEKRWLGNGPYRVYKNRLQGTNLNVYKVKNQLNIPGQVYNYPEFEGYFNNWYWGQINLTNYRTIGLALDNQELYVGLLKPNSGEDPKSAIIPYPQESGIYIFNYIAPIGDKWNGGSEYGPSGLLNDISKSCSGGAYFKFDWAAPNSYIKTSGVHIK
ncbi:glycoside hydrolase family 2 TIM barrel-domain containing protein [Mucilaginibacter sp. UYCu711]|uniref:glycoside hydrolase family 2 protein n=1 Tax=Mucilaginibacter sp. UYCu711 TaxID=3156339 RepID=UPI003D21691C